MNPGITCAESHPMEPSDFIKSLEDLISERKSLKQMVENHRLLYYIMLRTLAFYQLQHGIIAAQPTDDEFAKVEKLLSDDKLCLSYGDTSLEVRLGTRVKPFNRDDLK